MGVSTSRPSNVSEALVRKRKTSFLPAFETDFSAASNNKKARRRRSNEDDSPRVEAFEDVQQFPDQVIADHLPGSPSLRDSKKESPVSILKLVTPLLHKPIGTSEDARASFQHELRGDPPSTKVVPTVSAPLAPGTITKTQITSTTVTTTAITTPDGKTTVNTSTTRNTTNLIGRAEAPAAPDLHEFTPSVPTRAAVIRPCGVLPDVDQAIRAPTPDQETVAEAATQAQASPSPFIQKQTTNDTQVIDDLPAPAIPNTESTAPESIEWATNYLATKLDAPGISTTTSDKTPSFEDRIVELQEYFDEHGHLRVPQGCMDGSSKDLGVWVFRIRKLYKRRLQKPSSLLDEESSPGIFFLGPNKLSKVRIEGLEAMGFEWSARQRKHFDQSFGDRIAELRDYYEEHGHVRVPQRCTDGRNKDLGLWVKHIRQNYQRCLKYPSRMGEESPGIVFGQNKLSKVRIEGLEAMGFEWSVRYEEV
jgi:hypothetical protein